MYGTPSHIDDFEFQGNRVTGIYLLINLRRIQYNVEMLTDVYCHRFGRSKRGCFHIVIGNIEVQKIASRLSIQC
ncbi:hypothetical protein SDC9_125462 [bioreactor metagenome]|uniref:Uncharacterized protein n=1 Tax=bioreactor metagenome TaxID=1076179 RepID=A0A645CNE1_9ZZZZ